MEEEPRKILTWWTDFSRVLLLVWGTILGIVVFSGTCIYLARHNPILGAVFVLVLISIGGAAAYASSDRRKKERADNNMAIRNGWK